MSQKLVGNWIDWKSLNKSKSHQILENEESYDKEEDEEDLKLGEPKEGENSVHRPS